MVLIAGDRIVAVGPRSAVTVPPARPLIDTEGMSVLPGLMDTCMSTLMLIGHADYEHWDKTYMPRFRTEIMPIAARQPPDGGRDHGARAGRPLDDILDVKRRVEKGEIPGPRLFVSGPFIQKKRLLRLREDVPLGRGLPDDARAKVQRLVDAGVDVIKLIDQDQLTGRRGRGGGGHRAPRGKPVVAHAHREDEIRIGLKHGVDCFEHTGLATEPGYPDDILAAIRKRNNTLYWCPTIEGLFLADYTARVFPERLDDPAWRQGVPRTSRTTSASPSRNVTALDYFTLTFRRLPTLAKKFQQLRDTGVTMMVGTDSGIPGNFHTDSTWRGAGHLGAPGHDADAGHRGSHPLAGAVPQEGEGPRHAGHRTPRRRHRRPRRRPDPHRPAPARGRGRQERRAREVGP